MLDSSSILFVDEPDYFVAVFRVAEDVSKFSVHRVGTQVRVISGCVCLICDKSVVCLSFDDYHWYLQKSHPASYVADGAEKGLKAEVKGFS